MYCRIAAVYRIVHADDDDDAHAPPSRLMSQFLSTTLAEQSRRPSLLEKCLSRELTRSSTLRTAISDAAYIYSINMRR